jgi:hypothetical protein
MWITLNNMGEELHYGFATQKDAINYVKENIEEHVHPHQVKEVEDFDLWDCFTKQEVLCDGCHADPCMCVDIAIENGDVEALEDLGYDHTSALLLVLDTEKSCNL